MSPSTDPRVAEFYAQTYDLSVQDWPGEIAFYRRLASEARQKGQAVLEVACGTGRVAIRLAKEGTRITGLDLSAHMLAAAGEKSVGFANLRWVQADMCAFDLGETFGLALIPGHAFQNLNTPQEQVACLEYIYCHLEPGGQLVVHLDHQDVSWLGSLVGGKGGVFEPAERFQHPRTGQQIHTSRAWTYEQATQTAICETAWEAVSSDGQVVECWQSGPVRLHCLFRFEMEHLLARVGFSVEHVFGDFYQNPLDDESENMIWVVRKPASA